MQKFVNVLLVPDITIFLSKEHFEFDETKKKKKKKKQEKVE